MSRLTAENMTPAEHKAFRSLQAAVGFAPKVMFGRDSASNNHILERVNADHTAVLYAIATTSVPFSNGVREFRLLVATVPQATTNGTRPHTVTPNTTGALISAKVKASWAARRIKYGSMGRRWLKKPTTPTAS